jgi:mannose-6-phosphate isomerase-like protein (cupin superfamily)
MNSTPAQTFAVETVAAVDAPTRPVRHDRLETTIDVTDGVVCVAFADEDWILTPGDRVTIPAGAPFRVHNAGDDEARFVETFRVVCSAPDCPEALDALSA